MAQSEIKQKYWIQSYDFEDRAIIRVFNKEQFNQWKLEDKEYEFASDSEFYNALINYFDFTPDTFFNELEKIDKLADIEKARLFALIRRYSDLTLDNYSEFLDRECVYEYSELKSVASTNLTLNRNNMHLLEYLNDYQIMEASELELIEFDNKQFIIES